MTWLTLRLGIWWWRTAWVSDPTHRLARACPEGRVGEVHHNKTLWPPFEMMPHRQITRPQLEA
jgi:hypothetical protein